MHVCFVLFGGRFQFAADIGFQLLLPPILGAGSHRAAAGEVVLQAVPHTADQTAMQYATLGKYRCKVDNRFAKCT